MPKKSISEADLVDLRGKVAIVTGGNTGIGYATIQMLARKGAKVYMAARDEGRATAAIKQLQSEDIKDGSVHWHKLDLSDPRAAHKSAEEFLRKEQRLDILVNNAASSGTPPFSLTRDGLLDIMVTNHISPFAFTEALLPLQVTTAKEPGADVRIVNVSSMVHSRIKATSFATKDVFAKDYGSSFGGVMDNYGTTKLANILHVKALQTRLNTQSIPITCISLHPGSVHSTGSSSVIGSIPYIGFAAKYLASALLGSWRSGAATVAFAAAGKDVAVQREQYQGAYLVPTAVIGTPSKYALDGRLQNELYESTERFIKEMGL
ncbi:NAD-P-binding protein [Mycena albidolilacea]|uniref:NAD-P-binding protein n=1 Tax=Mycena albidolilacea TaxID=1033008 RepID=A0AAD6ZIU0_9AGAR|nr:NAD-P-binding protein [Mycena albidolilacea]